MKNFRDDIKVNDLVQPYLEPIVEQMTTVFDPEIELDIYNLGLIYEITLDETGHCYFLMTFTDTGCGCEETMPYEIAEKRDERIYRGHHDYKVVATQFQLYVSPTLRLKCAQ